MKNKKTFWIILGILVAILLLIYLIVALLLPRGLGPIEPFLNLVDLFASGDETTPGKPAYYQKLYDCSTGELVTPGELIQPPPGCDDWQANRFERPFNAIAQDEYYPDLDIQYVFLGRDANWYYLRFALFDPQPDTEYLAGTYAAEMDLDGDGRGDLLVLVSEPGKEAGKEWSTLGIQIWADTNEDVGGQKPNSPDPAGTANGYDTLLFNQGEGEDPNGAWARAFMSGSAYVELAFKAGYLDEDLSFKWWAWSSYGAYTPDSFELHDFYSHKQAGDAYEGQEFFPVKEVFAIDSTCAKMWGASPNLDDPDFCIDEPEYEKCCLLKFFGCKIPWDIPGDDPCVLPFEEWLVLIWNPAHPGEIHPISYLWDQYDYYLMDPYCPPEGFPTPTPTFTFTPELTPTFTPVPTATPTLTPTATLWIPTPTPVCKKSLNKTKCLAAGGTWVTGATDPASGAPLPPYCQCP